MTYWSIRMQRDGATFEGADAEYLRWASGQATKDLANGYATGLPLVREAARDMRERIMAAAKMKEEK